MRPLLLRIEGLRSYRKRQEIDFTGVTLMAIVGDTGSGKSSILEAICFALYGGTTFEQRSIKQLIADGSEQMRVELTFLAENRRYRVTRATSRTGYPPPLHLLVGLDDSTRIDNESAVTKRVTQLVGLDFDAFQRAVVLPQGRFQALLQATERERASILKGILRLEVLDQVREAARELEQMHRPRFHMLKVERAKLLDDPEAELEKATITRRAADQERDRLQRSREMVDRLATESEQMENTARRLDQVCAKLDQALAAAPHAGLCLLWQRAEELEMRRRKITETRNAAEAREKALVQEMVKTGRGASIAEIVGAVTSLESSLVMLEGQEQNADALRTACEEQEQQRSQLLSRQEALPDLETDAARARTVSNHAASNLSRMATLASQVLALLKHREDSSERQRALRERIEEVERRIGSMTTRRSAAQPEALALEEGERRAQEHLERIRRTNAAAHAASGCSPGDPCPVCERKLAAGFAPPRIQGEEEARHALETAREARERTQRDLATLEGEITSSNRELEQARKELDTSVADLEDQQKELRQHAPEGVESFLASLETANTEKDAAEKKASDLDLQLARAREAIDSAEKNLARRDQELGVMKKNLERDGVQLADRCQKLGVDLTSADEGVARRAKAGVAGKRRPVLEKAIATRIQTRDEMVALERERVTAAQVVQRMGKELAELAERTRKETEGDHRRHAADLRVLRERVDEANTVLGESNPHDAHSSRGAESLPFPAESDLIHDAEEAARLEREAAALAARLLEARHDQRSAAEQLRNRRRDSLLEHGVQSPEELDRALTEAAARALAAEELRARAESEIPLAGHIDHALRTTEPVLDGLKELTSLLADAKFIAFVVEQRQRSLLAIASEILSQVTGGRFGFSESFKILDRASGQPREVKTLSGGETFLASLALALALVELAGRSGGRLDALFLDEGFGTLDANCLNEALDALGRQAENGRLVAVISHLQAVTESVDRVLYVSREPDGSAVRWLGEPDREAFAMGELQAGLLR